MSNDAFEEMSQKEVYQRLRTPTFEAILHDGKLTLLFPSYPAGWLLERNEVEALTRFLHQHVGVKPLPIAEDSLPEG